MKPTNDTDTGRLTNEEIVVLATMLNQPLPAGLEERLMAKIDKLDHAKDLLPSPDPEYDPWVEWELEHQLDDVPLPSDSLEDPEPDLPDDPDMDIGGDADPDIDDEPEP